MRSVIWPITRSARADELHDAEQQRQVSGLQAVDIGVEERNHQHHRRDDHIQRHVTRAKTDFLQHRHFLIRHRDYL
jgi:hypothetical protein